MHPDQPDNAPAGRKRPRHWRDVRRQTDAMSLGIEMVMAIAFGAYLGYLFDGYFESGPWGMIFFLIAGIGAAGKAVIRVWRQTRGHLVRTRGETVEVYAHPVPAHADGSRWSKGRDALGQGDA